MTNAIVRMWGTIIGYVSYDQEAREPIRFEYARDFLPSGIQVSPITMPLSEQVYAFPALPEPTFSGLPGLLADSLPDKFGSRIFQAWRSAHGMDSMNPVERLCWLGSRGMGALEYEPDLGQKLDGSETIQLDVLRQAASDILAQRPALHGGDSSLAQLAAVGTSAGGARAKALIAWNEETGEMRPGHIQAAPGFKYWLAKFDGVDNNGDKEGPDEKQHTRIELAYYYLASAYCGIHMTPCRIYKDNGYYHFLTQRFDRDPETGTKIHMQSLCGLAHLDFNSPGAYSYEQAAMAACRIGVPASDIEQLYRRMAFHVFARNQDDHTKNISFLMNRQGQWMLSPAYDMTYSYNPAGYWTGRHQMTINGKREHFTRDDFLACASKMSIRPSKARKIMDEVQDGLKHWFDCAEAAELDITIAEKIGNAFVCL